MNPAQTTHPTLHNFLHLNVGLHFVTFVKNRSKKAKNCKICAKKGTVFRTKDENGVPFLTQLGTPGDVVGYAREVPLK